MKRSLIVIALFIFLLLPFGGLFAQSEAARPVSLKEALELAEKHQKKILIDVYASWCPYCQRMHNNVYTEQEVLQAIQDHFMWVKIDIESENEVNYKGTVMTEAEFAASLQNESIPTTYFLDDEGYIIGIQPGYIPSPTFSSLLKYVGSDAYLKQTFQEFAN